jgi:hypothetical protein
VSVPVLPQRPHLGTLLRFAILFLLAFFDFRFAIYASFNSLGSHHRFCCFVYLVHDFYGFVQGDNDCEDKKGA